jgi:hypothetical protein
VRVNKYSSGFEEKKGAASPLGDTGEVKRKGEMLKQVQHG